CQKSVDRHQNKDIESQIAVVCLRFLAKSPTALQWGARHRNREEEEMRMFAFAAGRVRRRVGPAILLLTLVCAGNAAAQSFLGTVRGTVVDPQGAGVPGAVILIVDEATGVPRALETDAQ